jgi:hypothetical protein
MSWLLFVAPLLAYRPRQLGIFSFFPPFLLVPLAALLGRRFGAAGVAAIAIGGLPFLISIYSPWGAIGGSPALYFIALAVAAIAASPRPLIECLRWPQGERAAWWLALAAPLLLVLYVGAGFLRSSTLEVSWNFGFSLIGYGLLFVLGARGVRVAPIAIGLAATAALSWALAYALVGLPLTTPEVRISAMQPSIVLAAIAMFSAGSATGAHLAGRPLAGFWRRPCLAVALIALLWFGPPPVSGFPVALPFVQRVSFLGVAAALPLAAFMAGLLQGVRGAVFVTALVTALLVAWTLVIFAIGQRPHFQMGVIPLEAPFVAAAYAVMGARVAETRSGRADFGVLRLPTFLVLAVLLVLGASSAILGAGGPVRTALTVIFVLAAAAAFAFALRVRRRMAAKGVGITAEAWAPFAAIVGVLGALAVNFRIAGALARLSAELPGEVRAIFERGIVWEDLAEPALAALVCLILVLVIVRGLVATVPKVLADAGKIAAFLREERRASPR